MGGLSSATRCMGHLKTRFALRNKRIRASHNHSSAKLMLDLKSSPEQFVTVRSYPLRRLGTGLGIALEIGTNGMESGLLGGLPLRHMTFLCCCSGPIKDDALIAAPLAAVLGRDASRAID